MYDPHYMMFGGNAGLMPLLDPSGGAVRTGRRTLPLDAAARGDEPCERPYGK